MRRRPTFLFCLAALLVLALALFGCGAETNSADSTIKDQSSVAAPTSVAPSPPPTRAASKSAAPTRAVQVSGFDTIALNDLPSEALETIQLINQGGPFPYRQDGQVFQNRERILPRKSSGYYHEYTVITPGEDDRGARRIITGKGGEFFYTDDHYESFRVIVFP